MGTVLLLRGGRVIDPAEGRDETADVLVRDGRIAPTDQSPPQDATVIDVRGKLVVPGLIDGHVHCFRGMNRGLDPDHLGISRGVTTVVDAGSSSQSTFPVFHESVIQQAQTRVLAYMNVSSMAGTVGPQFANLGDPRLIDPDGIAERAAQHRDRIVGLKMHATRGNVGALGMAPLRRARAIADELKLRMMIHVGETWGDEPNIPIEEVVELLRPDDVLTHMYTAQRGGLLDANGQMHPAVREARDRGVWFDLGHGSSNLNWNVAERLLDQDFPPDTVSTDGSHRNLHWLVFDLPTVMSKLQLVGLPLIDLIAMATSRPAKLLGREDELGSLAVGRVADISVLELEDGEWTAMDSQRQARTAQQRLTPAFAVRAGEVVYPRPRDDVR